MIRSILAPTSAAAVANFFLELELNEASVVPLIDQTKIHKLVYNAHAWWLAYDRGPLFDEDVEAWADGPIIKDLYCQFSACGRNPIGKKRARTFVNTAIGGVDFRFKVPPLPTTNIQKFLNTIWETHKHIPQTVLSESTQMPGEPWAVVKQKSRTLKNKPTIPNHLIRDIFQQKISGANQRKNQGSKMTKYKNG